MSPMSPAARRPAPARGQRTIISEEGDLRGRKLADNLVLAEFIHGIFGKKNFTEMVPPLREMPDGYDEDDRSFLFPVLRGWLISARNTNADADIYADIRRHVEEHLEDYDQNIRRHLTQINRRRDRPVVLTYFQYLAALYAEIYLDQFFSDRQRLQDTLNTYVEKKVRTAESFLFSDTDLTRLAFWMATGSGKTYVLHLNYLQFLHYNRGHHSLPIENIILITPNETMTAQHLAYCSASSIPAEPLQIRENPLGLATTTTLQVINIQRLTEEQKGKGKGVSVDVFSLGTRNLMFVDEGHKGSGGRMWNYLRDKLVEDGFRFEYSATFGEATATGSEDLLPIYAKSVLFDYSYRYFYNDGYGKDYWLLNVGNTVAWEDEEREIVMLANLLTFYQQKKICEEPDFKDRILKEYHIEPPLWIFVGSKVDPAKQESDIVRIVSFLHRILADKRWTVSTIDAIFQSRCPVQLRDKDTMRNLFSKSYPETELPFLHHLISTRNQTTEQIYHDILRLVFHAPPVPGSLTCEHIKNVKDQIALRAGNSPHPFGLIFVGKTEDFLKRLKEDAKGLSQLKITDTGFSEDLFATIKKPTSKVNLLIGAKKFIEGWDTMRVSCMGLLYVGKSEGTQIIQLFGRGVRLNGKKFCLKRSRAIEESPPQFLHLLETLSIFGIEADYLRTFRDQLIHETDKKPKVCRDFHLKIRIAADLSAKKLLIPHIEKEHFIDDGLFELVADPDICPDINLLPQAELMASQYTQGIGSTSDFPDQFLKKEIIELLDWQKIHFTLLDWKNQKGWYNVIISPAILREIIEKKYYKLHCRPERIDPPDFSRIPATEEIVLSILKKYLTESFHQHQNLWAQGEMILKELSPEHNNFTLYENQTYQILVPSDNDRLIGIIQNLLTSGIEKIMTGEGDTSVPVKNVHIENSLYQPLLAFRDQTVMELHPGSLNDGEVKTLEDLKEFIQKYPDLVKGTQIYLLRNQPQTGIGFPSRTTYFYPDFILWIVTGSAQNIIFIEPHSTVYATSSIREEHKFALVKEIRTYEKKLKERHPDYNFTLDLFIIDVTHPSTDGAREANHIYGQDAEGRYMERIWKKIIKTTNA